MDARVYYRNIYFKIKITAKKYISIEILFRWPVSKLMATYEIMPNEIPSEIL